MYLKSIILKLTIGLIATLLAVGFSFCSGISGKASNEGVIEYEVKAVDEKHHLAGFAPTTAILKFKNDKFIIEMSIMGMFNTMFVCDPVKKTLTQMVKFLDLKQASVENEKDIQQENSNYKITIEEVSGTKEIAGYKCNKLKVTMVNDPTIVFDAYYTKDIASESINALSPYKGVKGMLMQYRLKKMGLELEFTAKTVDGAEVPDKTFDIPDHYKVVSTSEMKKYFESLQ